MEQADIKKTLKLLEKYKIPFVKSSLAKNIEDAKKIAKKIKYPVVLKAISPDMIHKSDVGAVSIDIEDEQELEEEYEILLKRIPKKAKKNLEGVLVQKMETGKEIMIGMKKDPQFGPVILFGLGGIFVEVLKDTSLRIAPIKKKEAIEMIKEIKGYNILEGTRNQEPVDINSLANIIVKLSDLSNEKKVKEVDFNPVLADKRSAKVADMRIMIE